ncbi:MAG TPA: FHA domain-containing protein, partial [Polyangia bacterium]|nr:FHA domain-containing protein [Polyangia bacterium]
MAQPAVLHVIGGADRGKTYELVLPETRVGRGADQDLVLADIAVSRRHFTIHAEGGRYRMRDLGSGNGTLINGQRLDTVILNDGDQIECGNTLMRFDQAVARAAPPLQQSSQQSASSHVAPPPYASPSAAPMYSAPVAPSYPMASSSIDTPSDNVPQALPLGVGASRSVSLPIGLAAPLQSPRNRLIVYASMGALSLISLCVILAKTAFAKPPVVASEAEQSYRAGLKLFLAKDYEGAKINFSDALQLAPDSPDAKRYVAACDLEVHARGAMQTAERAIASHRYAEAVKALDAVDSASLVHDDASKRRKEMAPKAAAEDVDEARRLQQEDPDTARARVQQALALDPGNAEARALAPKMRVDLPPPPANNVVASPLPVPVATPPVAVAVAKPAPPPPPKEPKASAQKEREPPPAHESKKPKLAAKSSDDDDFAPVKLGKKDAAAAAKMDAPSSGAAQAAYKAKDFGNAERLYRVEARSQPVKQMEKTIQFANQVRDLKAVLDKAAGDEGKNPAAAVSDYEAAMAIDGRIGRGQHAAYFKQRIGKLQVPLAQQAFSQGKYEQAFVAVQAAQKAGAGDGGMLKQLEAKAKELTDKGAAVQKSNPGQAKQYWHQVIKIVPSSSPSYARAYQMLNAGGGGH